MTNSTTPPSIGGEFAGRSVLITGVAGIIGGWIADAFARCGARLFLTDSRDAEIRAMAADGRWSAAADVTTHGADLTDNAAIHRLCDAVGERFGAPDIVINNAGVYPHVPFDEMTEEFWSRVQQINVMAPFVIVQRTSRLMRREHRHGAIVNITSAASDRVQPTGIAYSTSKAGLAMLTRGAALALAPDGIRVNAVAPGFAPGSAVSPLDDEYVRNMTAQIPLGRPAGPYDAASAVLYLCSDAAAYITGTTIHVDGGFMTGR